MTNFQIRFLVKNKKTKPFFAFMLKNMKGNKKLGVEEYILNIILSEKQSWSISKVNRDLSKKIEILVKGICQNDTGDAGDDEINFKIEFKNQR